MLKALDKISSFTYKGSGSLYAWISRIAINTALANISRYKFRFVRLAGSSSEAIPEPTDEELTGIPQEKLLEIISSLPETQRVIFNMFCIDGYSHKEAHYIGIPVRADFTIARNRWLDVYVGAGTSADFCVAAFEAGQKIGKDGVGFSLIGAGGVQFNITDNLGIFLDPTLSWNIPSNNKVLDTYQSAHPFMFSVSTGLRVTIPVR